MAPSPPKSLVVVVLALLAVGVMPGTLAMPLHRHQVPELDITSSIMMGRPILGDKIGPFAAGQTLTLTCSTAASASSGPLSWWEEDSEQKSLIQETEGLTSSSISLKTLRIEDSGRRFTCKDKKFGSTKTIEIVIISDVMDILHSGKVVEDGETLKGNIGEGFILTCIVQGYNPSVGSWWESEAQQPATASWSTHATTSELTLEALTVGDSGRSFTCRAHDGLLSKTVTLEVTGGKDVSMFISPKDLTPVLAVCIVALVLVTALVFTMNFLIGKYSTNKEAREGRSDDGVKDRETASGGTLVNCVGKTSSDEKYSKLRADASDVEGGSNAV